MWIEYNPNPVGRFVGDCAVRALTAALQMDWDDVHELLSYNARMMGDMPNADSVWGATLRQHGFRRKAIPNSCPDCYTAEDFAKDHPFGIYVLGFGGHVSTVIDGDIYDSWDSSNLIPQFYWYKSQRRK